MHRSLLTCAQGGLALCFVISLEGSAVASDPPASVPSSPKNQVQFHASLAEGLGLSRQDKLFSIDAGLLTQMRFDATFAESKIKADGFNVNVVRPYLRVRALSDTVRLFVQPEFAKEPKLLDYELTWQPMAEVGLRVGQFLTPMTRAFLTPVPLLQFDDFSRANEKFRAGRDTGAMLFGATKNGKLDYWLGAFNGNGIDKGGNDDTNFMLIGRAAVNPVRPMPYDETPSLKGPVPFGIAIAVNGIADRAHPTKTVVDAAGTATTTALPAETRLTGGGDVAMAYKRFTFFAEGYSRFVEPDGGKRAFAYGGYAQTGFFVIPTRLEIAVRASFIDPNIDKTQDTETSFDALVTGYAVGNHLKVGARYMLLRNEAKTSDGFEAGTNHRLTIQTQLWL